MGEDRRQGDRRQGTGDRRGSQIFQQDRRGSQPFQADLRGMPEQKKPIALTLRSFIISIVILLVIIAGMMWYTLDKVKGYMEELGYYEDFSIEDIEVYDAEDYEYEEDDNTTNTTLTDDSQTNN